VYLTVSYDYVENRIGALSAHVTDSDYQLYTPFAPQPDGVRRPAAEVVEVRRARDEVTERLRIVDQRPLRGIDLVRFQSVPWTGIYERDNGAEMRLLQDFLRRLVDAIAEVADAEEAPIHFYVWSRSEMKRLLEACSRSSAGLMHHLQELLGCRPGLEQLIYSCLQDELTNRYALGWTSQGLSVMTSLTWFGQRYHWLRQVGYRRKEVDLEQVFNRDLQRGRGGAGLPEARSPRQGPGLVPGPPGPPYVRVSKGRSVPIYNLRLVERIVPGRFKRDGSPRTSFASRGARQGRARRSRSVISGGGRPASSSGWTGRVGRWRCRSSAAIGGPATWCPATAGGRSPTIPGSVSPTRTPLWINRSRTSSPIRSSGASSIAPPTRCSGATR